jgi:tetratricopeptide (TPR) repeat protein
MTSRRWLIGVALALLVALLGQRTFRALRPQVPSPSPPASVVPPAPRPPWPHPNEEEWLVADVVEDLAEMLLYAKNRSLGKLDLTIAAAPETQAGAPPQYRLRLVVGPSQVVSSSLVIQEHVWSPAVYEDFARTLLRELELSPLKTSPPPTGTLEALLELTTGVIERENQRISSALEEQMLNSDTHEQAALLLGALSLREAAGTFSDTRHQLCRMTAHLTLARVLRESGAASNDEDYALLLLSTLVNRQQEAMERIAILKGKKDRTLAGQAWIRALAMRNTGDWRILPNPRAATLLERLEYFRAILRSQGGLKALGFLRESHAPLLADWARADLEAGASLEEGNVFTGSLFQLEMAELQDALKASQGKELQSEEIPSLLNVVPGHCLSPALGKATPRVIDWGGWAAFFQRHLCAALVHTERHLQEVVGLDEQASRFREKGTSTFGSLELFPLIDVVWERRPVRPKLGAPPPSPNLKRGRCVEAIGLVTRRPEIVTARNWEELEQCFWARREGRLVGSGLFFPTGVPRRTAFDVDHRLFAGTWNRDEKTINELHLMAPYDKTLIRWMVASKYKHKPTPEELAAAFGPLMEYDSSVRVAQAEAGKDTGELRRLAHSTCAVDATACLRIADTLRQKGMREDAAAAYESALPKVPNRVAASNDSRWVVQYEFENGNTQKAMKFAKDAAGVYSEEGLFTLAQLLERMEKYHDAEEVYKAIAERYPDEEWELSSFYIRHEHRTHDGMFPKEAANALALLFPEKLQRVAPGELKANGPMPPWGVSARDGTDADLAVVGFTDPALVLAVDGYRVHNRAQYLCVMSLTDEETISFTVWTQRDGKIVEVKGPFKRWKFGPLKDHPVLAP